MKKKWKKKHGKKIIIALILSAVLGLTGCSPIQTVLGVGQLYGNTAAGLIMVLLDSGELESVDGEDPSNRIFIGRQEDPDGTDEDPEEEPSGGQADETEESPEDENQEDPSETGEPEDGADQEGEAEEEEPSDGQTDTEDDFRMPETDYYVYNTLSTEEQGYYDQMLDCVEAFEDSVVVDGADGDTLARIRTAILADHGDLFWFEGNFSYSEFDDGGEKSASFMPEYTMTEAQKENYESQVERTKDQWLAGLPADASEYERVKYVYEILIDEVTYDLTAENNQNILSVFLNQRTVCAGFAHAAQDMLQDMGVQCTYITGTANSEPHAWNLVRIDDAYYYMDVTWGNPSYMNASGSGEPDYRDYSYLNLTWEEISRDHTYEDFFQIPQTTASDANYFVMEDLCFADDDFSAVGQAVDEARRAGENLQIKFADPELYARALNELIVQQGLYQYCPDLGTYTYSFRESANTLYFFFDTDVL